MVVLYKLYVIYLQSMIRAILENKDNVLECTFFKFQQLRSVHCTESSHSHSTEALTPVLTAECGECSDCAAAATFKFNRPQAGRPSKRRGHWHWVA